jgi:hypothetical protein
VEAVTADGGELLTPHLQNFIDCIRTRQTPAADAALGLASSALCHWGNAAYRLGREVSLRETAHDAALEALINPPLRSGWTLPKIG